MYKLAKLLLSAPDRESCKKANLGTYILDTCELYSAQVSITEVCSALHE